MSNEHRWFCPLIKEECRKISCIFFESTRGEQGIISYCIIKEVLTLIGNYVGRDLWVRVMRG